MSDVAQPFLEKGQLKDFRVQLERCARCSYCKFVPLPQIRSQRFSPVCPSIQRHNFHAYSAGGRIAIGLGLATDKISYTDTLLDVVYRCTLCGACDISCKAIMGGMLEPLEILQALRLKCVEDAQVPPQHMAVIEGLRKEDNMMQCSQAERGKWAEGLEVKDLTKKTADVAFHAGCRLSFDEDLQGVARAGVKLLKNAGVDVGIMGKNEACCGARAYEIGYLGELDKYASRNIKSLTAAGVKAVVTACPECYYAFKVLYPKMGKTMNFEVLHMTQYLDLLIREQKLELTNRVPMTVTYHDPCHLGRLAEPYQPWEGIEKRVEGPLIITEPEKPVRFGTKGIYRAPRSVLKSIPGLNLVEMERIREYAWCCGAGGGVIDAYPDFARWAAAERIAEAKATGAEALVTACPWCERNLKDASREVGETIQILDIVEAVLQAI
jgi:Fe-S oxidoreductase